MKSFICIFVLSISFCVFADKVKTSSPVEKLVSEIKAKIENEEDVSISKIVGILSSPNVPRVFFNKECTSQLITVNKEMRGLVLNVLDKQILIHTYELTSPEHAFEYGSEATKDGRLITHMGQIIQVDKDSYRVSFKSGPLEGINVLLKL